MNDHDPQDASAPKPPGLSRRAVLTGTAGIAAAALLGNATGITSGITGGVTGTQGGAAPAEAASGQPVEPRHGAGEWTEDPEQSGLSQSATPVTGDIAAMPLDWSL